MPAFPSLFLAFCLSFFAHASEKEIPVEYVDNYDGDTISVNLVDLKKWDKNTKYEVLWKNISVRIGGIDTPELKGSCPEETKLAKTAKAFVHEQLVNARKISIDNTDRDKYFRILAEVFVDDYPLSQLLLDQGLAIPYDGGTKSNYWCTKNKNKAKKKR